MDLGGSVDVRLIMALALLVMASWMRAAALSGRKDFDKIFQPIKVQTEFPSPWTTLVKGVRGCLRWLFFQALMVLAVLLAITLLLAQENTLKWLLSLLF